jgi:proline dehydrogenase
MLMRTASLRAADSPTLRALVETRGWFFAKRFVAGQTLDEAVTTIRRLNDRGILATVDHLGEHVSDVGRAKAETDLLVSVLERINKENLRSGLSVKLTTLGMGLDDALAEAGLLRIVGTAAAFGRFVRVDMEESAVVDRTLRLFRAAHAQYPNVGVVIQAYLHRSPDDIRALNAEKASVRLCKGAYMEPPSVAIQHKTEVDKAYKALTATLLEHGHRPAIATHHTLMIDAAKRKAEELRAAGAPNADPSQWEFQMLYGIRRDLQDALVRQGYRVRVYVPYGTEWYPYFMRRLAERPANIMFFLKSLRYR